MRSLIPTSLLLVSSLALASVGCSHSQPPPATANNEAVGVAEPTAATLPAPKSDQYVNVGPQLRSTCDINDKNQTPKFDFDNSQLSTNDRDVLAKVAQCLTTGALQGKNVSLVGRADPRGEAEYNMNLGEQRAMAAKTYLQQLGVQPARIGDTSRGALDATGHDEDTWRNDRRVDIEIAN